MCEKEKLKKVLRTFESKKILVVGDIILDRFVRGKVTRISPEAPVPVVNIEEEQYLPGGAGNVVSNLLQLGASVSIVGVIGEDIYGRRLIELLNEKKVDTKGVLTDKTRPTSIKTRIIAEHQQLVRMDLESKCEITREITEALIEKIAEDIKDVDGIIISDYGKGLITSDIISSIISGRAKRDIPVVVDPQVGHFFEYLNVTSITPNLKETCTALKCDIENVEDLVSAGKRLLEELSSDSVLITRGEKGMSLFLKDGSVKHIPTAAREVYDVTGAGDTVASVFTLALTAGLDLYDSAVLSNYAAAVVVGKHETATASKEEIEAEINRWAV